jgi:outer membrane receptor protein involved in Fe transport
MKIMKSTQNILAVVAAIFLLAGSVNAQRGNNGGGNKPQGTIEGHVYDAGDDEPLEFANVSLFKSSDSSMVTGAIADKRGHYIIEPVSPGKYYLIANFIGYSKQKIENITLRPPDMKVKLDPVKLKIASQNLEGVNITAERNRVEYKIDRKIINVSKDLNAAGGSAVDVLENTPSVEVDIEGNVSVRGSENFKVYVDGKPTVLDGNDFLQQLPASSIEQIEIITNPSAKYDPDGSGGIINVITKKDHRAGVNGIVNASVSTDESMSGDFLLNYKTGKVKWFVGADYRDRRFGGQGKIDRETYAPDTTFFYSASREREFIRDGYSFKTGFDYEINDRNTLSLSGTAGNYGFGIDMNSKITNYTDPVTLTEYFHSESVMDRNGDYYQGTLNYDLQFNDDGHRLQAMAYYSTRDNESYDNQEDLPADANFEPFEDGVLEGVRSTEEGDEDSYRFKIDYSLPITEDQKFEAGAQTRLSEENNTYDFSFYENYENETGQWVNDPDFYNEYTFDRHISSVYSTYSGTIGILGVQAGFRGEFTDRSISNITGDSFVINRWDWFPSLHTSLDIDDKHKLMASYSKRIRRPRGWFLDPVISYRDRYTLRQGNPALEPEYTDSYDLSLMKRFDKGFATIEAFYRNTTNEITRINQLYDAEENIMLMTFENINKEERMGAELMINADLLKWWSANVSGSYYRFVVEDNLDGRNISRQSNNWTLRLNNDFTLAENSRIQLRGYYRGPSISIQGERGSFFYTSVAVRHDFMQKRLNVTASMRDVFGTMGRESITDQPNYYVKQDFNRDSQIVRLSVSYKINDYKRKRNGRQDGEEPDAEMEGDF